MDYNDGYYLNETGEVRNHFEDMEQETRAVYKKNLVDWKKELIGDRSFQKVLAGKIAEAWDKVSKERMWINELNTRLTRVNGELAEWTNWQLSRAIERKKEYEKDLKNWEYKKEFYLGKVHFKEELNVEGAKTVPIDRILGESGQGDSKRKFFKCPLHNENHASFCWFVEQNRWHCFGESVGGDSIDLYMKLNNCDFITAVKSLNHLQ
jgi:hypothetical protein